MCTPAYRALSEPGTELRSGDASVCFSVPSLFFILALFRPFKKFSPQSSHLLASRHSLFLIEQELNECCHGRRESSLVFPL